VNETNCQIVAMVCSKETRHKWNKLLNDNDGVFLKNKTKMKQTTKLWQWCILKKQGANEAHIKCKTKRLWVIDCIGRFNWAQALMYIK
jgi:hypothetical protein